MLNRDKRSQFAKIEKPQIKKLDIPNFRGESVESTKANIKYSENFKSARASTDHFGLNSLNTRNTNHLRHISDVFDNKQVNQAINSAAGFSDRLKVVDFILKKRMEVKIAENKVKFDKAAPVLKNFHQGLKNRLNIGKNVNKFRAIFRDSHQNEETFEGSSKCESSLLSGEATPGKFNVLSGRSDYYNLQNNKDFKDWVDFNRMPSIELQTPINNNRDPLPSGAKTTPNYILNSSPRQSFKFEREAIKIMNPNEKVSRSNFSCRHKNQPVSAFMLANADNAYSKNEIAEKFTNIMALKSKNEIKTKRINFIRHRISKSVQEEAKKKFESDLYNYLSKNGPESHAILQNVDTKTNSETKIIEAKALAKFNFLKSIPVRSKSLKEIRLNAESNEKKSSRFVKKVKILLPDSEEME